MVELILNDNITFPNVNNADANGLLAVGGNLSTDSLINAYSNGIFPWFEHDPICWYAPDPRFVLLLADVHFSKSLLKLVRKNEYEILFDQNFKQVMNCCRRSYLQEGTWISKQMIIAYNKLYDKGIAHSVEVWRDSKLVGGLYGVLVNNIFSGESMFHFENDTSKVAMYYLIEKLKRLKVEIIDCQIYSNNLHRYGAKEISRDSYIKILQKLKQKPEIIGQWEPRL